MPRVLFVDDDPDLLAGLRAALRREPYEIVCANSAAEALDLLGSRSVDVIVSDERMPGMAGSEFFGVVERWYPNIVRILLTGQASLSAAIRAINEGGVYRFLTKPVPIPELASTIRGALLRANVKKPSSQDPRSSVSLRRKATADALERSHPGITHIERSADGAIVLLDEDGGAT